MASASAVVPGTRVERREQGVRGGTKSLNTVTNVQGPPAKAFSALASASAVVPRLRDLPLRAVAACCLLFATSQNVAPQNSRNGPRKFQKRCCLQPATGPYYFLLATCCLPPAACNLLLLATCSLLMPSATSPWTGLLHCRLLLAACCLQLATCPYYFLLAACYLLLATCYSLLCSMVRSHGVGFCF